MKKTTLFFLSACMIFAGASAQLNYVYTVMGGYFGDGMPALKSGLYYTQGMAVDKNNNVYFTLPNSACRIDASTGIIHTVAGVQLGQYTGDGGLAVRAGLNTPVAMAVDSFGNIYIADESNQVIRKINSATHIITTFAGNGKAGYTGDGAAATTAELNYPCGVAVDDSGNVFISDRTNSVIREVRAATGKISTYAGKGIKSITLSAPYQITFDNSQNLFIADAGRNQILKITPSGSLIVVAGTGANGASGEGVPATSATFSGVSGVAVDDSDNVFIADANNNAVREVRAKTGLIRTYAGKYVAGYTGDGGKATSADIYNPINVGVDKAGNVYMTVDYEIRKVNPAGIISTYAGNNTIAYAGDGGIADSAEGRPNCIGFAPDSGNFFFSDNQQHRIRKVNIYTGKVTLLAGNGTQGYINGTAANTEFNQPYGVAADSAGNVFIADRSNEVVCKYTNATGKITTIAGQGLTTGYTGDGGLATASELWSPIEVDLDDSDNVYILDQGNNAVRKIYNATGKIVTLFKGSAMPHINSSTYTPSLLAISVNRSTHNIYIADNGEAVIREWIAATGTFNLLAGNATGGYSGDGGPATAAKLSFLSVPAMVADQNTGDVYFTDGTNKIRKVTASSGIINTIAGTGKQLFWGDYGPADSADFFFPSSLALDKYGNLYACDADNDRIRRICQSVPSVSITGNAAICKGTTTTFKASGAITYKWSTGSTADSITVSPTATTTYSVTGNDTIGCPNVSNVTVTIHPVLSVTGKTGICMGDSTTLKASGGISYLWNTGKTTDTIVVKSLTTTSYKVNGTDTIGCSDTISVKITVHNLPVITISGRDTVCSGALTLLKASGAYSYLWSTGATGSAITLVPLANGRYKVTGTDINGCLNTDSIALKLDSIKNVTITGDIPICKGFIDTLKASATGGIGSYTYKWNPGNDSHDTVWAKTNGVYSITITDSLGCKKTVTDTITVHKLPLVMVTGMDTIIKGAIDTLVAGGANNYVWTGGSSNDTLIVSPTTTTTYTIMGTDSNGCVNSTTFTVFVNISTGVNSISGSESVASYPNPVSKTLYLSFIVKETISGCIQVMNSVGEQVMEINSVTLTNDKALPLDISTLANGIYFVKINSTQLPHPKIIKVVKQ